MSTVNATMLQRRLETADLPLVAPDGELIVEKAGADRKLHVGTGDGLVPITVGSNELQSLLDVLIASPTARQALMYSSSDAKWKNSDIQISDVATLSTMLSDLSSAIALEGVARSTADDGLQGQIDDFTSNLALKEDKANKDQNDGYAGLDSSGLVLVSKIPNLPAAKITSGILALAQGGTGVDLSAAGGSGQVLKMSAGHVISSAALVGSDLPDPSSTTKGGVKSSVAVPHQFVTQIGTDGSVSKTQPDFSDLASNLAASQDFTFQTAGEGYFWGGYGFAGCNVANGGGATITPNGANRVNVFMFPLTKRITVRKVLVQVVAGVDGSVAAFGIYDTAGNKLIDSGSFSSGTANNNTTLSNTLGTPVTLDPGMYFYAFAGSSTATFVFLTNGLGSGQISGFLNKNATRVRARGTNTMSSGVLPSTLGTLIADATVNLAACMFES